MQKHFFQKLKQKTNYINRSIFDILLISARPTIWLFFNPTCIFILSVRYRAYHSTALYACAVIRPSVGRDSAGLGERVPSCSARASPPSLTHSHSPRSRRLTSRDRTNGGRQIRALTRNLQQPLRCQPISWGAGRRRIATRTAKKGGLRGNNRRLLAGLSYF